MSTGLYCYALTRGVTADDLDGGTGIGGGPLGLVEHHGLAAVVSDVDLEEFGEEGLRRNLEDLAWLERVALAHDRVTREVAGHAVVAPLRLATVFLGEESLRARLGEWHEVASAALDRIEGRDEWSVKAYADPAARPPADDPADDPVRDRADGTPREEGVGAGRAYLMRRRAATKRRETLAREDAAIAENLHDDLHAVAVAGRRLAAQDRQLSGHEGEMILNGAYLVDRSEAAAFRDRVGLLAGRHGHVRVEVQGPWPPYSFASLEQS